MKQLFIRQWFLIALGVVLFLGFFFSTELKPLAVADNPYAFANTFRKCVLIVVLFLMALPLESRSIWNTIRRPWAALLGSTMNVGILPLVAWLFSLGLRGDLAVGLILAATAPCTMASAAVWTRRAGGNDTVAILVTIITNAFCFLVTPFWLYVLLSQSVAIDTSEMITNLAVLVVLPMIVAQIVRQQKTVGAWATKHKTNLSSLAQSGILIMVSIGAIRCGLQLREPNWDSHLSTLDYSLMFFAAIGLHLSILFFGKHVAALLGFSDEDQIAVAISGSQKTLMVGIYVAINYFGGITMLPMVVYHIGQLVADTMIADRWSAKRLIKNNRTEV